MYKQKLFRPNKYHSIKQSYNGYIYDSKFEAQVASELDLLKKKGLIKDWDRQFKVTMWAYNKNGDPVIKKTHKVDFRIHENDGSYRLVEAKGFETTDYKERRNWLEKLWLPENPDYTYEVWKKNDYGLHKKWYNMKNELN